MDANVIANLMAQVVTIALVIYVGLHLRSRIQTLQTAVDAQKATINAQAEQLKAQSTLLQDSERLDNRMKLVIDTASPPASLQREQAYYERVQRDATALLQAQEQQFAAQRKEMVEQLNIARKTTIALTILIGKTLPFIPADERVTLIDAVDLPTEFRRALKTFAENAPLLFYLLACPYSLPPGAIRAREG